MVIRAKANLRIIHGVANATDPERKAAFSRSAAEFIREEIRIGINIGRVSKGAARRRTSRLSSGGESRSAAPNPSLPRCILPLRITLLSNAQIYGRLYNSAKQERWNNETYSYRRSRSDS